MEKTTITSYTTPAQPTVYASSTTVVNDRPPVVTQFRSSPVAGRAAGNSSVTVVHQTGPTVVHHHHVQTGPTLGGFLSSVGRAVTDIATETSRVVAQVVQPAVAIECFQPGFVVELKSKLSGKKLQLIKGGLLNCKGEGGAACHFRVKSSGRHGVYKFQSVAQPEYYLAFVDGFIVGYGNGDKNSEFIVSTLQEFYVTLECCHHLGNVLGSLPSGDITNSLQTTKDSDVAQFAPHIIQLVDRDPSSSPITAQ